MLTIIVHLLECRKKFIKVLLFSFYLCIHYLYTSPPYISFLLIQARNLTSVHGRAVIGVLPDRMSWPVTIGSIRVRNLFSVSIVNAVFRVPTTSRYTWNVICPWNSDITRQPCRQISQQASLPAKRRHYHHHHHRCSHHHHHHQHQLQHCYHLNRQQKWTIHFVVSLNYSSKKTKIGTKKKEKRLSKKKKEKYFCAPSWY